MQISEKFPVFTKETLFVVTSKQCATFYTAFDKTLEKKDEFCHTIPPHQDNEGFFVRSGGGTTYGSGNVKETQSNEEIKKFTREFAERLHMFCQKNTVKEIILFVPDYMDSSLKQSLKTQEQSLITRTIHGNFTQAHPFKLLEKITLPQ